MYEAEARYPKRQIQHISTIFQPSSLSFNLM